MLHRATSLLRDSSRSLRILRRTARRAVHDHCVLKFFHCPSDTSTAGSRASLCGKTWTASSSADVSAFIPSSMDGVAPPTTVLSAVTLSRASTILADALGGNTAGRASFRGGLALEGLLGRLNKGRGARERDPMWSVHPQTIVFSCENAMPFSLLSHRPLEAGSGQFGGT